MIKAGHNGGILASIMHTGIANMLMWQIIKEEWGVRVTSVLGNIVISKKKNPTHTQDQGDA